MKIIQRGAEAIILKTGKSIVKRRIEKSYRIPQIDERIRKLRTRNEAKLLEKASKVAHIPSLIESDEKTKELKMEFIEGEKLSENLDNHPLKKQESICKKIGKTIGKIHDENIIHGDLTTSNIILKDNKVYLIDFGLGFSSHKNEDKAVDLHVLKQALEAKHFKNWEKLFKKILEGYKTSKDSKKALEQYKKVEKRGRYKAQY